MDEAMKQMGIQQTNEQTKRKRELDEIRKEVLASKKALEKKSYDRGAKTDEKINKLVKNIDTLKGKVKALDGRIYCPECVSVPGLPLKFGLVKQKKSFSAAEQFCRQYGGHLASFHSKAEVLMISNSLRALKDQEGWEQSIRTGAKGEGSYYSFTDGTPFPNDVCTTKACGEPWLKYGYPIKQFNSNNCVDFYVQGSDKLLQDNFQCSRALWFLCKF